MGGVGPERQMSLTSRVNWRPDRSEIMNARRKVLRSIAWALAVTWPVGGRARSAEASVSPSASSVSAALARAKGGDVIRLTVGGHGDVALRGRHFQPPVRVVGRPGAYIQTLSLRQCRGLVFEDVQVEASLERPTGPIIRLVECHNVELRGLKIIGPPNGSSTGNVDGITVAKSSNVSMVSNALSNVRVALGFRDCEGVTVSRNRIFNVRTDGVRVAESRGVTISDNYISHFGLFESDHRDGIQFYTLKGAEASRDIVVEGNRIEQASGAPAQGVFMRTAGARFERVRIRENLIAGGNHNGIAVLGGADNVQIEGNLLIGARGWVRVTDATELVVSDNEVRTNSEKRFLIEPSGRPKSNQEGRVPKDGGARARAEWIARHPKTPD